MKTTLIRIAIAIFLLWLSLITYTQYKMIENINTMNYTDYTLLELIRQVDNKIK